MAQAAVAAALSRINGRHEPVESVIEPTLIVRGTTAAPRKTAHVRVGFLPDPAQESALQFSP